MGIAKAATPRPYRSRLRAEQAQETRARILDAALRVMAGPRDVPIPDVAREGGVSVPTIYRHFGTKTELLNELYPHVARRASLAIARFEDIPPPRSLDELRALLRAVYARIEAVGQDDLAVAALSGPAADEVRRASMPRRLAAFRPLVETLMPGLGEIERDRIARVLVVLTTSSALRTWLEYLGSSADEAADDVDWVIRSALAGARKDR
jgi:AcrR family transcriptional regulator